MNLHEIAEVMELVGMMLLAGVIGLVILAAARLLFPRKGIMALIGVAIVIMWVMS